MNGVPMGKGNVYSRGFRPGTVPLGRPPALANIERGRLRVTRGLTDCLGVSSRIYMGDKHGCRGCLHSRAGP